MQYLRADTVATILIGPFVAPGDGVTPVTDVTLAGADHAELMKHDGTTFADLTSDSRAFTHKEGGWYTLVLGTGDTDTEGRLTVLVMDTDKCLPVWNDFMVVNANVYDSLFAIAETDYLQVDAKQLAGSAIQQTGGYPKVKDDEGNPVANEAKQNIIDTVVDAIKAKTDTITWADITLLKKIEQGRWKVGNNQMIFYDEDGEAPLLTFDLKDKNGQPTMANPYERKPV